MKTTSRGSGRLAKILGFIGIGLCALCCALPVLVLIGGAGILTGIAMHAEKLAIVLLITSSALFAIWLYKRTQAPACDIDCECKVAEVQKIESTNELC